MSLHSLNSDYDYLKIHLNGSVNMDANTAPSTQSSLPAAPFPPSGYANETVINHGLGYIPMFRVFWDPDKNGTLYGTFANPSGGRKDPWLTAFVDTANLTLILNTDGGTKSDVPVYYRIYDNQGTAVDSDSAIDKIFKVGSSSVSVPASGTSVVTNDVTITIPHGADETPFFTVQFSENSTDWYPLGSRIEGTFDTTSGPPGGPYSRIFYTSAYAYSDADNLYIVCQSNYTASAKTIYVRYALDYAV